MRFAIAIFAFLFIGQVGHVAQAEDMGTVRKLSDNKLGPLPGMPSCIKMAVESGDPTKGGSVIVFRGTAGCQIPRHWHTPTEHVMMVSGSAKVEMMHGGSTTATTIGPGGYAMMPSKHVHQFTCVSACLAFVSSDAAFDIHYVDEGGKEIAVEIALASKKK